MRARYGSVEFHLDMAILRFTKFEWFILESNRNLTEYSQVDIRRVAQGKIKNVSDEQKQRLIANRKPTKGFGFPAREYTDNCRPDGKMNRYCNPEWFDTYKLFSLFWTRRWNILLILYSFPVPAQKWFSRNKTYPDTLHELEESYRLIIRSYWRMWVS